MESVPSVFEALMIICFGVSWPAGIWKTYTTKSVRDISVLFLWFVFVGYISGVLFKLTDVHPGSGISPVIFLYILNTVMVGIELVLYYRYRSH